MSRASCPSIQPYATPPTGERATIAEALRRLYERGRALADLDASLELSRELEELFADVSDVLESMVAHHDSGIPPAPESAVFEEPPEDVHALEALDGSRRPCVLGTARAPVVSRATRRRGKS